jgi:hypothetical protein
VSAVSLRWYSVVVDCRDLRAQATWWADVLDWAVIYEAEDEMVIVPKDAQERFARIPREERCPGLVFVPVEEGKTLKNRLHIDLALSPGSDQESEVRRLVDLGASRVDVGQDPTRVTWAVLADPEGNEFCVLSPRE